MNKRDRTHITSPVRKNDDATLNQPSTKKHAIEKQSFEEMTVIEKAHYINHCYSNNEQWMIDYPHSVVRKCNNITPSQMVLYNYYCAFEPKTRLSVITFISCLTHEQLAITGI